MKINHIGIAVESIEKAVEKFSILLGNEYKIESVEEQKVRVAIFRIGDSKIELLEPTGEDSPIAVYLKKKGEGIHHIAIEVEDIEKITEGYKEKGIEFIFPEIKKGAHNTLINFLHPKQFNKVLIEIVEQK